MLEALLAGGIAKVNKNAWSKLIDFGGVGRYTHGMGVIDGKIYVHAGAYSSNPSVYLKDMWCYDPVTAQWTAKTPSLIARRNGTFGVAGGKFYAYGGINKDQGANSNDLQCYDPVTDTWTAKKAGPVGRYSAPGIGVGTKFYVFSGYVSITTKDLWCYDTLTDLWTALTPAPAGITNHCMAELNNKLYVCGLNGTPKAMSCYDIATDTWSTLAETSSAPTSNVLVALDNKLYMHNNSNNGFQVYDPALDSWSIVASSLATTITRSNTAAVVLDGSMYMMGGYDSNSQKYIKDFLQYFP